MRKHFSLTYAVLASTLLVVPVAYADITVSTPLVDQDTKTSVAGDVAITSTGQLAMTGAAPNGGDAIVVDSDNAAIAISGGNVNAGNNAIVTTGIGHGINITNGVTGIDALISLGSGSGITSGANSAILIDNKSATVVSTGNIKGFTNAIEITANGTDPVISLEAGSTTTSTTGSVVSVNGTGLSLGNAGTITGIAGNDALDLMQNFTSVINNEGGLIQTVNGSGIHINGAGPVSGDISNGGTIGVSGTGAGISITNTYNGSISNKATGTIGTAGVGGNAIEIAAGFSKIDNSGAIGALGNDIAIEVTANAAGTINNSGVIGSVNESTIVLGGNITQINNTGSIGSVNNSAIYANKAGVTLSGGIVNNGSISNGAGGTAIDLGTFANIDIKLTQQSGTIFGDVLLASNGGSIFDMSGGTIDGDVTGGGNADIVNLTGGTITGTLNLDGGGNTVNLSGTSLQALITGAGADTFNVSGGSFTSLDGGAGADVLNVNATFTSGSITNVETINATAGVFTVGGPITQLNTLFDIDPGVTVNVNSTINGTADTINDGTLIFQGGAPSTLLGLFTNNGTLGIGESSDLTVQNFTQNATGVFAPEIYAPGANGNLTVVGAATNLAGFVYPYYVSGIYIPSGSSFDVITAGAAINDNGFSLIQPNSVSLYFTSDLITNPNILTLIAAHRPLPTLVQGENAQAVAAVLDALSRPPITTNPALLDVLGQIDTLTSGAALEDALNSLTPTVNYALVQASKISIDSAFESVLYRVEKMKHLKPLGAEEYTVRDPYEVYRGTGQNYGDGCCGNEGDAPPDTLGVWFKAYGSILEQKKFRNFSGYKGDSVGYAIGSDWGNPDVAIAGLALSYTNTHTVGSNMAANIVDVQSVQGTAYAWIEPIESLFIDAMFGFAQHKYYTRRNIGIGTFTTAAFGEDFYGTQYAVQTDLGYAFTYDWLIVAPVGRFKYGYLGVDSYTETGGAAGVNLSVENKSLKELVGGVGIRLLSHKTFAQAQYDPEVSAMILYDFCADGQEVYSNFFGGGGIFPTTGPNPSHTTYLYGLGITAYTYDNYSFQIKYNLQIGDRYHFYANSGFMQLRGEWG